MKRQEIQQIIDCHPDAVFHTNRGAAKIDRLIKDNGSTKAVITPIIYYGTTGDTVREQAPRTVGLNQIERFGAPTVEQWVTVVDRRMAERKRSAQAFNDECAKVKDLHVEITHLLNSLAYVPFHKIQQVETAVRITLSSEEVINLINLLNKADAR